MNYQFWKFTICSSVVWEDRRALTELVPVSFLKRVVQKVAVIGAILSSQVRLSLNVVIWPSLETVVLALLVDPDTVLETVVSLSTEMVLVSVLDTVALEGGATNWRVTDFNAEAVLGVVVQIETVVGVVVLIEAVVGVMVMIEAVVGVVVLIEAVVGVVEMLEAIALAGSVFDKEVALTLLWGTTTSAEGAGCSKLVEMQAGLMECWKV